MVSNITQALPTISARKRFLLLSCITVFVSSSCIMVLELVATRIIARYLGSSLYTWTSVIGVVLAGITLGNYLGGRIADRFEPRKALAILFAVASGTCVVTIISNNLVGTWNWLWYLSWPGHVFVHVSLVFLLPSLLLGTISPVVAKMALDQGLPTGRTVGDIYAWGAAGSIAGTFAAGYFLIATMGTVAIIWLVAAVLLLIGIFYWARFWFLYIWAGLFCCILTLGAAPWQGPARIGSKLALRAQSNPHIIYEAESQYSYIAVEQVSTKPDRRKFLLDRLTHSAMVVGDILDLQYPYEQIFSAVTHRLIGDKEKFSVMVIGGGGYVYPRYIQKLWPASRIDVVEIDPQVTEAAIQAFGLEKNTTIRTIHKDARNYVDELLDQQRRTGRTIRYDFIFEDAINDYSVPFQLITRQFNEKIAQLLTEDGVYLINLIDIFDTGLFLGAVINTLEKTFPHVYVFSEPRHPHTDRNTFVIIAAPRQLDLVDLEKQYTRRKVRFWHLSESEIKSVKHKAGPIVLSDDYAPVENLLAPVVCQSSTSILVNGYIEHAQRLARDYKFDQSIAAYNKAVKLKPALSVKLYNRIGTILGKLGKTDQQVQILQKAITYDQQSQFKVPIGAAHYNLAQALRKSGKPQQATWHFDKATEQFRLELRDNPNSPKLLRNLGHSLAEKGDYAKAGRIFKRVLDLQPIQPSNYVNLALTLKIQGKHQQALKVLGKGQELMSSLGRQDDAEELKLYITALQSEKFRESKGSQASQALSPKTVTVSTGT